MFAERNKKLQGYFLFELFPTQTCTNNIFFRRRNIWTTTFAVCLLFTLFGLKRLLATHLLIGTTYGLLSFEETRLAEIFTFATMQVTGRELYESPQVLHSQFHVSSHDFSEKFLQNNVLNEREQLLPKMFHKLSFQVPGISKLTCSSWKRKQTKKIDKNNDITWKQNEHLLSHPKRLTKDLDLRGLPELVSQSILHAASDCWTLLFSETTWGAEWKFMSESQSL